MVRGLLRWTVMNLRYSLFSWLQQERLALTVAAAGIAIVACALLYLGSQAATPVVTVAGTVRGFGIGAEETGNFPIIIVESPSGLIIQRPLRQPCFAPAARATRSRSCDKVR